MVVFIVKPGRPEIDDDGVKSVRKSNDQAGDLATEEGGSSEKAHGQVKAPVGGGDGQWIVDLRGDGDDVGQGEASWCERDDRSHASEKAWRMRRTAGRPAARVRAD